MTRSRHRAATLLKPAPGIHDGTYFTLVMVDEVPLFSILFMAIHANRRLTYGERVDKELAWLRRLPKYDRRFLGQLDILKSNAQLLRHLVYASAN